MSFLSMKIAFEILKPNAKSLNLKNLIQLSEITVDTKKISN